MMLSGSIGKERGLYGIEVDVIGVYSQGRTRRAACDMLVDGIYLTAGRDGPLDGFEVTVTDNGDKTVSVTSNDSMRLTSMVLRYQRELHDMTLADVAEEMGAKSRNGYAVYEQRRQVPSVEKLEALLAVVAPELALSIVPRNPVEYEAQMIGKKPMRMKGRRVSAAGSATRPSGSGRSAPSRSP